MRPTALRRPLSQSILGENTPPQSSTMQALQSMSSSSSLKDALDMPLTNITNGQSKTSQSLEGLGVQLLSLTNIATALQKEMAALSRRSRDNATDLLSLKQATNTRDEDIRKSLRDLVGQVNDQNSRLSLRESFNGGFYLDSKPHNPPNAEATRTFQLPRIPSPKSFAESIDRDSTPSLSGVDTSASVALLEKILRGLGTRDGQESLYGLLRQLSEQLSGMATSTKVDELADFVRSQSESAIVSAQPRDGARAMSFDRASENMELDFASGSGPMTQRVERLLQNTDARRSSAPSTRGAELLNDDLLQIIRTVKDSVSQGGGLTAEVKALVRELRGEVLGMGREIAKRLEDMDQGTRSLEVEPAERKDDVSRVIDQGLEQMKEQLNNVLREHRRQSAASSASQKTVVDYQEIYNAMRAALRDNEASQEIPDLNREDVIEAVRDAWEAYKPEVEAEKVGLEREEIMACLKEGLQEYQPDEEREAGATREEVFTAVVEGLKHFVPPQVDSAASLSRDEIIEAVRDCLEEFEFPVSAAAIGNDMTRQEMVHAVKEGLEGFEIPASRGFSSEDNGEVMSRLQDIMEYMKLEFRAVSEEAKDNVAANGRDTEQVLDATKDGLESLRIAIESYVDRASGAAGNEEFMDRMAQSLEEFKEDVANLVSHASESSKEQLQVELEGLREVVNTSMVPAAPQSGSNKEILETIQNGLNSLRQDFHRPRPETSEILDALNDGLNDLRAGIDRITNKPADLTANDEILDALKSGLDSVRSDIETLRDASNERSLAAVPVAKEDDSDRAVIPLEAAKHDDIKNLEVLISQLHIKMEAMAPDTETVQRDDITRIEDILRDVQQNVIDIGTGARDSTSARDLGDDERAGSGDAATRDDVQAIENILHNTKARLDDLLEGDQAIRKEDMELMQSLLIEHKDSLGTLMTHVDAITRKEDIAALEELLAQVIIGLDELKDNAQKDVEDSEKVTKTDVETVEARVLEIKSALDVLADMDFAAVPNKEDISNLETLISNAQEKLDEFAETSTKAFEERQAEIVGVGERVSEVKTFLEELQEAVHSKLDDGATGVEALGKLLETMGEKIDKNENVGEDLKEMFETMKSEFEVSKEVVAGARLESDEKLQEATDNIASKIEDKIGELISKYDEFQASFDEKAETGETRNAEIEAAVVSTKAVSEDLKLLIDTLGTTVTDSLEKMEEASKTVFERVEDLNTKSDENHADGKTEHQQTRDHILQAVTLVEGLQDEIKEYQPQILEAVKDLLLLVGQHYEHSKTTATDIHERIVEAKPIDQAMLPAIPEKYDDSVVREQLNRIADQRYDDSGLREKLDRLEEKYDNNTLNEKLDILLEQNTTNSQAFAQLENLDRVHESVVKTAAQMTEFLSGQTQRITEESDDRERTLQDTAIALERKLAEKDHVEASVASLLEEEARLRESVMGLRTEQDSLIRQKTRLTGDVSSLETALRLRRDELSEMEARAERLERRIVEGVMDHSRVLLMNKSSGKDSMNRKRVKKPAAGQDGEVAKSSPRPAAVNMALSTRRSLAPTSQNGAARRIASLSQMTSSPSVASVKRSQSVRSPAAGAAAAMRKRSWGGALSKVSDLEDKENMSLREEDEESIPPSTPQDLVLLSDISRENSSVLGSSLADDSDNETMRRTSHGTTIISSSDYTESDVGYSEYDDTASEWTESAVGRSSYGGEIVAQE